MGVKHSKKIVLDRNSSSSVFEESLKANSDKNNNSPKINLRAQLINELKQEVNLPIENDDCENSPEIIFEKNEISKIKTFFEEDDNVDDNGEFLNKFFHKKKQNFCSTTSNTRNSSINSKKFRYGIY